MTAREYFGEERNFIMSLGRLIHGYERNTGGKIIRAIEIDRLLSPDGEQIMVTPQPHFDRSGVVIEPYSDFNGSEINGDQDLEEFKKRLEGE